MMPYDDRFYDGDDEEETEEPSGLLPEQRQQLQESIAAKYAKAADTADIDKAEKDADWHKGLSSVLEGLTQFGMAKGVSRGGAGVDTGFFNGLRSAADTKVANARQKRKDAMENVLKSDEIGRREIDRSFEDATREQTKKGWTRAATKQGWEDSDRARQERMNADTDEATLREQDPESMESKTAQALARKMMPSQDFTGMSASKLKASLPMLEKMYAAEMQRLGRLDTINAMKDSKEEAAVARKEAKEEARSQKVDDKVEADVTSLEKGYGDGSAALRNNLNLIDKVAGENEDDIPGVGVIAGHLPDWMISGDGVKLRQSARTVIGNLIKMRSGTAASDKEVDRMMKELGMDESATEKSFKSGMAKLRQDVTSEMKQKEAGHRPDAVKRFQERGGVTSKDMNAPGKDPQISEYAAAHKLDYAKARAILVNRGYKPNE